MRMRITFFLLCVLGSVFFCLAFYILVFGRKEVDYLSLYLSAKAFAQGENPYQMFSAQWMTKSSLMPCNLNPPIALFLFRPLSYLPYTWSASIWLILSVGFEISTLMLITQIIQYPSGTKSSMSSLRGKASKPVTCKDTELLTLSKTHKQKLVPQQFTKFTFVMCGLFSNFYLFDLTFLQLGSLLAFCVIVGYWFYLKGHIRFAGFCWGGACALKLFPGLLAFYLLVKKQYQALVIMSFTFVVLWIIPWLESADIYHQYFIMFKQVTWYADTWNASVLGYLTRVFHLPINIYPIVLGGGILYYLKKLQTVNLSIHQQFCFTLLMMLCLSPLGWAYYFTLLALPCAMTAQQSTDRAMLLWLFAMFLLLLPLPYLHTGSHTLLKRVSVDSVYFYALCMLIRLQLQKKKDEINRVVYYKFFVFILMFGMSVRIYQILLYT